MPKVTDEELKTAEKAIREAVGKHGAQHREVLQRLEEYIVLLRGAQMLDQAEKLEERAGVLRKILAAAGAEDSITPQLPDNVGAQNVVSPAPGDPPSECHFYSSRGRHIATSYLGYLYSPDGKHLGRWANDLGVFLDNKGSYLGHIVENNRLARDNTWKFISVNFGSVGNPEARTSWRRQSDIDRLTLPAPFQDVSLQADD
jgi:hypothetical protein